MTASSPRLLLNAEPFGFGPTAAIASFFPHLRSHFDVLGYVGKRHTLDLQKSLDYDAIHDVSAMPKDKRREVLKPIFDGYDVFLSAMDHKMIQYAQEAGLQTMYYDALTWYWPEISEEVLKCDLYMGQDFYGVQDRLKRTFNSEANAFAVPPIIGTPEQRKERNHILINLGGLQNPFWPLDDVIEYAQVVVQSLKKILPQDMDVMIVGSKSISDALGHIGVRTYDREAMKDVLAETFMAFMTPGLGNIYDAAAYSIPTIWLPPANDSQGQQLDILQSQQCVDGCLAWSDIANRDIVYTDTQTDVLNDIANASQTLSACPDTQARFTSLAANAFQAVQAQKSSKASRLIKNFGTGGEIKVTELVKKHARKPAYA